MDTYIDWLNVTLISASDEDGVFVSYNGKEFCSLRETKYAYTAPIPSGSFTTRLPKNLLPEHCRLTTFIPRHML